MIPLHAKGSENTIDSLRVAEVGKEVTGNLPGGQMERGRRTLTATPKSGPMNNSRVTQRASNSGSLRKWCGGEGTLSTNTC